MSQQVTRHSLARRNVPDSSSILKSQHVVIKQALVPKQGGGTQAHKGAEASRLCLRNVPGEFAERDMEL